MNYKIIIVLLFCIFSAFSETIISDSTTLAGVWTKANSPYVIKRTYLRIGKLTIEPGVTIQLDSSGHELSCDTLNAAGTVSDSILFISNGSSIKGITIYGQTNKTGYVRFQYCRFENVNVFKLGIQSIEFQNSSINSINSRVEVNGGNITINNSVFENYSMHFLSSPVSITGSKMIYNDSSNKFASITMDRCTTVVLSGNLISGYGNKGQDGCLSILEAKTDINNCIFSNNLSGIFLLQGDFVSINNNSIHDNLGNLKINQISYVNIYNNKIYRNFSSAYGGGITLNSKIKKAIIVNNLISNNMAKEHGGGIFTSSSDLDVDTVILAGNVIVNNRSNNEGGGCYLQAKHMQFTNNTIACNHAAAGGGLFFRNNCSVTNSIIYHNTSDSTTHQIVFDFKDSIPSYTPSIENCDIQGGISGVAGLVFPYAEIFVNYTGVYNNNINADPLFVNGSVGSDTTYNGIASDWRISKLSPCVDKGNNSFYGPEFSQIDFWDLKRIFNNYIDIGANEYNNDDEVKMKHVYNPTIQQMALKNCRYFDLLGRNNQFKKINKISKMVISKYGQQYKPLIFLQSE